MAWQPQVARPFSLAKVGPVAISDNGLSALIAGIEAIVGCKDGPYIRGGDIRSNTRPFIDAGREWIGPEAGSLVGGILVIEHKEEGVIGTSSQRDWLRLEHRSRAVIAGT